MRPDSIVGSPRRPLAGSGGRRSIPSGSGGCATKGKRGRGRHACGGVPPARLAAQRASRGLRARGGGVDRAAWALGTVGVVRPCSVGWHPCRDCEPSPGGGARLSHPFSSWSDSLLAKGLLSPLAQTSAWLLMVENPAFPC